ncbi:hypothetical protein SY88_23050 [Clostridiales bacterium PH28_bin88]|nr:hypothetical protein SY88_23050 [Clostridiales bacterium PH28_bin88]
MKGLRKFFLTGIVVLLPLVVTIYVLVTTFRLMDGLLGGIIRVVVGHPLPGLGVLLTIGLVLLAGMVATNVIGKRLIAFMEHLVNRIPLVKSIYGATKQIIDAFSLQTSNAFQRVALVEYPRQGVYAVGFVTGNGMGEVQEKTAEEVINIFVPTTPNPTSGMLVLVPRKDVTFLEMSVEDGLKLIISGGVVTPKYNGQSQGNVLPHKDIA